MAKYRSERPANAVSDKYLAAGEIKRSSPVRNKYIAGILSFFLGFLGVHQFYLRHIVRGIVILAVTVLAAVLSIILLEKDFRLLCFGAYELLFIIRGLVYILESEKMFRQNNKIRTF